MADFIIPQGREFQFTLKIMEKETFLTQDVETFDPAESSVQFRELATMDCVAVAAGEVVMEKLPDDDTAVPLTYRGGRVKVTLADTLTAKMSPERGEKVDGYYLKPTYEGIITVGFTDPEIPTRTVLLEEVYVVPASC